MYVVGYVTGYILTHDIYVTQNKRQKRTQVDEAGREVHRADTSDRTRPGIEVEGETESRGEKGERRVYGEGLPE